MRIEELGGGPPIVQTIVVGWLIIYALVWLVTWVLGKVQSRKSEILIMVGYVLLFLAGCAVMSSGVGMKELNAGKLSWSFFIGLRDGIIGQGSTIIGFVVRFVFGWLPVILLMFFIFSVGIVGILAIIKRRRNS